MRMWILLGVLILGAMVAAWFNPVFTLAISALILAVFFLARNLEFGVLVLVFFFPYLGLVIDFGAFDIFREVPYLRDINAPFIDLYGLLLFVAWILQLVLNPKSEIRNPKQIPNHKFKTWSLKIDHWSFWSTLFPHGRAYLLFWLSGLISLLRVPAIHFATSLKYFVRPFTFAYAVFFVPTVSILSRTHNPTHPPLNLRGGERRGYLFRVLMVFYATGLLSALNGLLGFFFGAHEGFPRATPLGFFGVNPLGPNHNLLAETLIATAPAGLMVRCQVLGVRCQNLIRYGMFFQWMVALLTFSRTAWIAVAVQAVVYVILMRHPERSEGSHTCLAGRQANVWSRMRGRFFSRSRGIRMTIVGVAVLLAAFFIVTTFSETVRGSTLSRLDQVRIAWFYFLREPVLGQGIGTFIPTLWQTRAFLLDYGEPLEAHGVLFKLMFEQGLLGLTAFGIFIGAIVREIWKKGHVPALMIAVGSLTYQLFNTTYYTSKLWVPLAIALAISKLRTK